MAPKYKLAYFDAYGRAEHIRYIFAYANQEYEDVRIKHVDWPSFKATTPFGTVPVLEVDGKTITQSNAIARYLGKQFGLACKDEWESLQCDALVDTLQDLIQCCYNVFFEKNPEKQEELKKQLVEKDMPFYLGKFDKIVADNPQGYLVGPQITWADLTFATNLDVFEKSKPDILKPYPALERLLNKVHSNPGIKAWIEKRPANPYKLNL